MGRRQKRHRRRNIRFHDRRAVCALTHPGRDGNVRAGPTMIVGNVRVGIGGIRTGPVLRSAMVMAGGLDGHVAIVPHAQDERLRGVHRRRCENQRQQERPHNTLLMPSHHLHYRSSARPHRPSAYIVRSYRPDHTDCLYQPNITIHNPWRRFTRIQGHPVLAYLPRPRIPAVGREFIALMPPASGCDGAYLLCRPS